MGRSAFGQRLYSYYGFEAVFEHLSTKFGYSKILMGDHNTHFLIETINTLTKDFQVYHQKSTLYHPQANGIVEAFNKILENTLIKVCNV